MTRLAICSQCSVTMPPQGPLRIRDGEVCCATCRPGPPPRAPRTYVGGKTTNRKYLTRAILAAEAAGLDDEDFAALADRPRTWGECRESTGPCPWVACRHHLYLDINPLTGSIKLNHPDLEPEELEHPCALRLAHRGPQKLEDVGRRLNLTRERTRQLEVMGLRRLHREAEGLAE